MEPIIRPAVKAELPSILRLYAQPELDNGAVLSLAAAETIFDRMQRYPDYRIYVAEVERQIVGTFALLIMDNLAHVGAPSGVIEDVAVAPAWQGRGIGKRMMEFARECCREAGCYKMVLSSNTKREQAHAFYESLGFEKHGYSFRVDLGV
jgi:GNAT superfamily N-acetyltransferase